jgi:hypothetical protein
MKLQLLIALGLVSGLEAYAQNVPKTSGADTLKTGEKRLMRLLLQLWESKKKRRH